MKSKIVLFLVAFLVWCLLVWPPDWQHLSIGVLVAGLVALVIGDLFINRAHLLKEPKRYWYFVAYYVPVFIWECLKANIDVARRVLHPQLPINPGIVKIKTRLKTDTALTFLANSITLTPGTMSVDIDAERGFLYVHWIDVKAKDTVGATRMIAQRFEKILIKIFD
jgi:multicomponent Na+:H+ antiporter subunit E